MIIGTISRKKSGWEDFKDELWILLENCSIFWRKLNVAELIKTVVVFIQTFFLFLTPDFIELFVCDSTYYLGRRLLFGVTRGFFFQSVRGNMNHILIKTKSWIKKKEDHFENTGVTNKKVRSQNKKSGHKNVIRMDESCMTGWVTFSTLLPKR